MLKRFREITGGEKRGSVVSNSSSSSSMYSSTVHRVFKKCQSSNLTPPRSQGQNNAKPSQAKLREPEREVKKNGLYYFSLHLSIFVTLCDPPPSVPSPLGPGPCSTTPRRL